MSRLERRPVAELGSLTLRLIAAAGAEAYNAARRRGLNPDDALALRNARTMQLIKMRSELPSPSHSPSLVPAGGADGT